MNKQKARWEFLLLLCMIVFGVACLVSESGANALTVSKEGFTVSFYANLIASILIGVSVLRVIFLFMEVRKISDGEETPAKLTKDTIISIGLPMVLSVFFVYGMRRIGFYTTASLTLFIMYMAFEKWNKKEIPKGVLFSVGVCVVFAVVFKYLKVFLPNTPLF